MDINEFKRQLFYNPAFQEKWQTYLAAFGKDINGLFGGDFGKLIPFAAGLECLYNRKLGDAYDKIRNFEDSCQTESDRQILSRLLALCQNQGEMAEVKVGDWVKQSSHGYYRVVEKTPEFAVLRLGFDQDLIYVKQSRKIGYFKTQRTDLNTYQPADENELVPVKAFFADHPEEERDFAKFTVQMLAFRERILKAGFLEAETVQFHFYRHTTDGAALVLNLADLGDCLQIVYGVTTIPGEEYFCKNGEDDDDIKLRHSVTIFSQEDEALAEKAIREQYAQYRFFSKDEILTQKKEKQKAFLQKIADRLKPLGFKKKSR